MITIYTDGACRNNQSRENIGAWAFYLDFDGRSVENAKVVKNTTNNRMELTAAIEGLKHLLNETDLVLQLHKIVLISDSTYVIKGINEWHPGWIKKNWKGVENSDLWKQLIPLTALFSNISFQHVKGHSGHPGNERVDKLCNEVMDNEGINN